MTTPVAASSSTSTTSTSAATTTASTRASTSTRSPSIAWCRFTWPGTRTTARTSSTPTTGRRSRRLEPLLAPLRSDRTRLDALRVGRLDPAARRGAGGGREGAAAAHGRGRPRAPMAPELALGGVQRWLQTVIVHPGTVDEALPRARPPRSCPPGRTDAVVPPRRASPPPNASASTTACTSPGCGRPSSPTTPAWPASSGPEAWERLVTRVRPGPPLAQLHAQRPRPGPAGVRARPRAFAGRRSAVTSRGSSGR